MRGSSPAPRRRCTLRRTPAAGRGPRPHAPAPRRKRTAAAPCRARRRGLRPCRSGPVYGQKDSDSSYYNSSGLILTAQGPPAPVGLARHGSRHAGEPKILSCSLRHRARRHNSSNYIIVWAGMQRLHEKRLPHSSSLPAWLSPGACPHRPAQGCRGRCWPRRRRPD